MAGRRGDLVWRIERAEARNALACARGHASWHGKRAEWRWLAGGYAIFAGYWTHLTQGVAIGVSGPIECRDVDRVSSFFADRRAVPTIHISARMPAVRDKFHQHGYREIGENHIVARRLTRGTRLPAGARNDVQRVQPHEQPQWERAVAQGFLGKTEITNEELGIGATVSKSLADQFMIRSETGDIAGAAAFSAGSGVGLLFADSTRPEYRRQGVQTRLIQARLAHAMEIGCDLVTAVVSPGSASEKNYLQCGFQVLYTRLALQQG